MTPVISVPAELPDWACRAINLADPRLGAQGVAASDEFFAPLSRMLEPGPAVFVPGKYDDHGKWMDGWETRRKRVAGHDWAVIKLGRRGCIAGFDVDTSHFTGNFAPAVMIEGCDVDGDAPASLEQAVWSPVLSAHSLTGDRHHLFAADGDLARVYSHLRLHLYPDGGIARLRVYGRVAGVFDDAGARYDLAALVNGARAVAWNDAHYGVPANLLLPGRGVDMGDGWETRRRREPGNDWCIIELGAPGIIECIEVDTAHFKGNYPDRCLLQAARVEGGTDASLVTQSMFWPILLPERPLSMDAEHRFDDGLLALGAVTHVRFSIIPDGGVSRLRVWGRVVP